MDREHRGLRSPGKIGLTLAAAVDVPDKRTVTEALVQPIQATMPHHGGHTE